MKKNTQPFLILLLIFFTSIAFSQDISQLKNVDVNSMSDDQIESYWSQIKKGGYTMAQVEVLGLKVLPMEWAIRRGLGLLIPSICSY